MDNMKLNITGVILYSMFLFEFADCGRRQLPVQTAFHGSGQAVDQKMSFEKQPCQPLQEEFLTNVLGAAFNPRYMSVSQPSDNEDELENTPSDMRRKTSSFRPFSVDEGFTHEIDDDIPAWELNHFESDYFTHGRKKRSESDSSEQFLGAISESRANREKRASPWECKSVIKWIDLGDDYFPRYLRNVECMRHDCWYGRYECRPKSFTVKLLRRKHGRCAYDGRKEGVYGLPRELKEMWIWEERAVNFCCECASPS